ncbi:MAG: hypothetical protein G01um101448_678 [Parcubacteria group bacterium Gr01-1014_48]|nr:MAG: hypothetical protein Greene041614_775 [Parcubacteria group bacterium Greene0416_14]TSC73627.1 MAG: hypothetical protein G01um101448_678 [Parcubacteria group bacterium Gr01-1014_48]TSD00905.1 MAG: hypothetical protein Greene101415_619 [Parcubacteria group bacterium Greene1014_15]TSD07987.1 MAG: hypothetical protein Greene07144_528 [Parcubacteria group bacterium Greene0714_4]
MQTLSTDHADPLHILQSTHAVLEQARFVHIDIQAIPHLAAALENELVQTDTHTVPGDQESDIACAVQKSFMFNVLNFCFWAERDTQIWTVEWPQDKLWRGGSYALAATLDRAEAEGYPIYDTKYLARLSLADSRNIFRGTTDVPIPLFKDRVKNLREAGKVLCERAGGSFMNIVRAAGHDAINLIRALIVNFHSFDDCANAYGKRVHFYKRAQICAHHIVELSRQFPELALCNTDELTVFADYRLPQVYRHYEALVLLPSLARTIDSSALIHNGSMPEVEIRSATVWIGELVRQHFKGVYSARQIDSASWRLSQKIKNKMLPHLRVYTIFY